MNPIEPRRWAQQFHDDLTVEGEGVPFERVLRSHRDSVQALRNKGLTWASIARLLARVGVRRRDGGLFSADHVRVCFGRISKNDARPLERTNAAGGPQTAAPDAAEWPSSRGTLRHDFGPLAQQNEIIGDDQSSRAGSLSTGEAEDVTDNEIDIVLGRLNHLR